MKHDELSKLNVNISTINNLSLSLMAFAFIILFIHSNSMWHIAHASHTHTRAHQFPFQRVMSLCEMISDAMQFHTTFRWMRIAFECVNVWTESGPESQTRRWHENSRHALIRFMGEMKFKVWHLTPVTLECQNDDGINFDDTFVVPFTVTNTKLYYTGSRKHYFALPLPSPPLCESS